MEESASLLVCALVDDILEDASLEDRSLEDASLKNMSDLSAMGTMRHEASSLLDI